MSSSNRLSPAFSGRYPKRLRGRRSKATAEAAVNSVRRNTYDTFECRPLVSGGASGGAATGTAGNINNLLTGKNAFEYCVKGTQTILAPTQSSAGLQITQDLTADDGVEYTQGVTSRSKSAFTVGTDGPFFIEVQFSISDVSGTDDCAVGFRKAEAYQGNIDDYDEMACLNVIAGDIKIETILNNATTVTTDTTSDWADAATKTLRVEVDRAGKVTYLVDGTAAAITAPFTFDSAEVLVPFLFLLNDTDIADTVTLKSWSCGLV